MSDKFTNAKLPAFNPPAYPYQDDGLNVEQRQAWSDIISRWMTCEIDGTDPDTGGPSGRTKLTQFFNGRETAFNLEQKPIPVSWIGFPNLVRMKALTQNEKANVFGYI
jgi:hypothetical protein